MYGEKERRGLAACLAKFKGVSVIGGMFMPKMNDLFSPLLFFTHNTSSCVTIFFLENRKGWIFNKNHGKERYWLPS